MRRRRQGLADRLRGIASVLLQNFKAFSVGRNAQQTRKLRETIDNYMDILEQSASEEELQALEADIKKLVYSQRETEQLRNAQLLETVQRALSAVVGRVSDLSEDSEQFMAEFQEQMKNLELFASEELVETFRERLSEQILILRQLVESKHERERQFAQNLNARVQTLEQQLDAAHREMLLDPLTQVYNRRAFDMRLEEDVRYYAQRGGQFALVMFDIDHFKQVNDTHGHLVGDRVLRALGRTAREVFRAEDFVARYGGEEFAAILHDTGGLYAVKAAERFRLAIANKEFHYERENTRCSLRITVSLGVANFHPDDTPESLIERADQALYLAKNSGRNQVKTDENV